jgi:hypothetical protein
MSALEEIILTCAFFEPITPALPLFSQMASILARREAFPALQLVTILLSVVSKNFNAIETIKMGMPLLSDMGILIVN